MFCGVLGSNYFNARTQILGPSSMSIENSYQFIACGGGAWGWASAMNPRFLCYL